MSDWLNNVKLVAGCFLLLAAGYIWSTQYIPLDFWSETEPFNARSMPYLIGWACVVVCTVMIVLPSKAFNWSSLRDLQVAPAFSLFSALVAYGFTIDYLGFVGSTIAFLILGFLVLGEKRPLVIMLVAVGVTGCFWLIMDLLGIYLNPGEWFL